MIAINPVSHRRTCDVYGHLRNKVFRAYQVSGLDETVTQTGNSKEWERGLFRYLRELLSVGDGQKQYGANDGLLQKITLLCAISGRMPGERRGDGPVFLLRSTRISYTQID